MKMQESLPESKICNNEGILTLNSYATPLVKSLSYSFIKVVIFYMLHVLLAILFLNEMENSFEHINACKINICL